MRIRARVRIGSIGSPRTVTLTHHRYAHGRYDVIFRSLLAHEWIVGKNHWIGGVGTSVPQHIAMNVIDGVLDHDADPDAPPAPPAPPLTEPAVSPPLPPPP